MSEGVRTILGKKYISARQAAFVSGYSQDYVGQLCRAGKIDAKRVGRGWYVNENDLLNYEKETKANISTLSQNAISSARAARMQSKSMYRSKASPVSSYGRHVVKTFAVGIALILFFSILFTSIPTLMERKISDKNSQQNRADVGGVATGAIQTIVQDLTADEVKVWSDGEGRTGVIRSEIKETINP